MNDPSAINLTIMALFIISALSGAGRAQAEDAMSPESATRAPISVSLKVREITDELVLFVAKVGKGATVELPAGSDLLVEITKLCGKVNATGAYLAAFAAANPGLSSAPEHLLRLQANGPVLFPECIFADEQIADISINVAGPRWQDCKSSSIADSEHGPGTCDRYGFRQPDLNKLEKGLLGEKYAKVIEAGDLMGPGVLNVVTEGRLADRDVRRSFERVIQIGRADLGNLSDSTDIVLPLAEDIAQTLSPAVRGLKSQVLNQDIRLLNPDVENFSKLPPTARIIRPVETRNSIVGFIVGPGIDPTSISNALPQLESNIEKASVTIAEVEPIVAVASEDALCDATMPAGMKDTDWPIPVDQLSRVLQLNNVAAHDNNAPQPAPAPILVVDTGFPPLAIDDPPLRANLFLQNNSAKLLKLRHRDIAYINDFIHVIDFSTSDITIGSVAYHRNGINAPHGINVVSLALGGVGVLNEEALKQVFQYRYVMPANAYKYNGNTLIATAAMVQKAVSGVGWKDMSFGVVNLSLQFREMEENNIVDNIIMRKESVIFVVAAGNAKPRGLDIADTKIMPAALGGPSMENVITVAAVEANGGKAQFSNYGKDYVDIAAPGCSVPVLTWDEDRQVVTRSRQSGTSMAAPLVSFTAAQLKGQGGIADIARIKRRIIASADYEPKLEGKVLNAGRLNVPKALAFRFDVVETMDGVLHIGWIDWQDPLVCNRKVERKSLLKLNRTGPGNNSIIMLEKKASQSWQQSWQIVFKPSCSLEKGELQSVAFYPVGADAGQAHLTWGEVYSIPFDTIRDITFSERGLDVVPTP